MKRDIVRTEITVKENKIGILRVGNVNYISLTDLAKYQNSSDPSFTVKNWLRRISTIDYIGAVQGIPICFDAKECVAQTFPLQNIHDHQVAFMEAFEKQQGIAFVLIYYSSKDILYYMRFAELKVFWDRAKNGGRKSVRFDELDPRFFMKLMRGCYVPYLDAVNLDLELREELDKE